MRRVISLWLPRFATDRWAARRRFRAARPEARAPAWPGGSGTPAEDAPAEGARADARPGALVAETDGRQTLAAVDDRASAAGLAPGMPLADARAQLPELATAAHDPDGDRAALQRLAAWCGRYSPWTAPDPVGGEAGGAGVLIDASGCAHLFGGEQAMLADLVHRVGRLGFAARAAMADSVGAAWALARFAAAPGRSTVVVPEGGARGHLAPLPPAALRLDAADCELLHRLGLRSVDELAAVPRATLAPRVGRAVARRLDQALGRVDEPVEPLAPVAPLRARQAFAEPIGAREDLAAGIAALVRRLCRQLDEVGQGARRLELTLYRVDGSLQPVTLGTSRASREPAHLKRLFAEHLDALDPGFGVEVMTLAAVASERLAARQLGLSRQAAAGGGRRGAGELAALVDRLEARLGAQAVTRPRPCASHHPERAVRAGPAFGARGDSARGEGGAWPATAPRPLRLVAPPQPLDATAPWPEGPPAQLRLGRLTHRVAHAEGPERIAPEWWRPETPQAAATRDYWRVETADGRRYWVYRAAGRWYLHGLFA